MYWETHNESARLSFISARAIYCQRYVNENTAEYTEPDVSAWDIADTRHTHTETDTE
jgi:hypothetical protein